MSVAPGQQVPPQGQPVPAEDFVCRPEAQQPAAQVGGQASLPQQEFARSPVASHNVAWYGGRRREVEVVIATGHLDKGGLWAGRGALGVRPRQKRNAYENFYTTDLGLTPPEVIEHYARRWNMAMFQRCKYSSASDSAG
ncbi:MAG: hypothetical protein U0840_31315 [Gemmataceae bacterium]